MSRQYFNPSRPVFVKSETLQSAGRIYKRGDRMNWEFSGVPYETMLQLFASDLIHHHEGLEEEVAKRVKVGDGLEELLLDELHILVGNINRKVKDKTKNDKEFLSKKCSVSRIKDKQIGLIRRWRTSFGELEN